MAIWDRRQQAVTLLRLEGIAASVAHRAASLAKLLAPFGTAEIVEDAASAAIWASVRDVAAVRGQRRAGRMAGVADRLSAGLRRRARRAAGARDRRRGDLRLGRRADLGGAAAEARRPGRAACAQRVDAVGGHAMLLRASDEVRRNVDVFHPQARRPRGARRARPPQLRSEEHPQSRPDDCGDPRHEDRIQPRPTRRSRYRGSRQDPARLRALRILHRDLPDLCAARRRTR